MFDSILNTFVKETWQMESFIPLCEGNNLLCE